jgi:hypothetical protein
MGKAVREPAIAGRSGSHTPDLGTARQATAVARVNKAKLHAGENGRRNPADVVSFGLT